ncbi:MAG: helix-turn-helix transcriptional regulator [Deltaproteobacteria bacterium]|nr:helix-turn-helix transcriptional regulator [Deltaproteobacteria bacterium]
MIFHAKIKKEENGYQIQFIELPNVVTFSEKKENIIGIAREALVGCVEADLDRLLDLPLPKKIKAKNIISISLPLHLSCVILFKKLRHKERLTTAEIAKKLGISRQAYERLESSRANPSAETIERVLTVLGASYIEITVLAA